MTFETKSLGLLGYEAVTPPSSLPGSHQMIYKQMSKVMKDIGAISKDGVNSMQNYRFRGIDQFLNALHPALVKHEVFMTPIIHNVTHEIKEVTRGNGKPGVDKHVQLRITYRFYACDGSFVDAEMVSEGIDSGDKATNKALSAAMKYMLIQTFSIPTDDVAESDEESPKVTVRAKKETVSGPPLLDDKAEMTARCHAQIAVLKEKKKWNPASLETYLKESFAGKSKFADLTVPGLKQTLEFLQHMETSQGVTK